MSKLLCPDCGHDVENHGVAGCVTYTDEIICKCLRAGPSAALGAHHKIQRAAAIAHLKALGAERKSWRGNIPAHVEIRRECDIEIAAAIAAYRAVGILKECKP